MGSGAARGALLPDFLELPPQHADALLNAAAVHLQFRFAGAARPDAAAQTREIGSDPDEIGLAIAQLRQFDLQFAFAAARVPRENVQYQHGAVDDRKRHDFLEILALTRTQVVENQDQIRLARLREFADFVRLAAADQRRRVNMRALLYDALQDLRARRKRQRLELREFRFDWAFRIVRVDGDDDRARRLYVESGRKCSISQDSPSL